MDEEQKLQTMVLEPDIVILPLRLWADPHPGSPPSEEGEENEQGVWSAPSGEGRGDKNWARREYRVTFITAGYVKKRSGGNAPWRIPAETLQAAVQKLDSVAVFVDHPGWLDEAHSLRDLAGVTCSPEWNGQSHSIDGRIRLYDREDMAWLPDLLDQILDDQQAGKESPDVGLSLVFYGRHDWIPQGSRPGLEPVEGGAGEPPFGGRQGEEEYERVTSEISHIESADLVFGPGAEGRLREALAKQLEIRNEKLSSRSSGKNGHLQPSVECSGELPGQAVEGVDNRGRSSERPRINQLIQTNGGNLVMDEDQVVEVGRLEGPQVGRLAEQSSNVQTLEPSNPAPELSQLAATLQTVVQQVERLTQALGQRDEAGLVIGMGQAHREGGQPQGGGQPHGIAPTRGRIQAMLTGLDRFAPNVDWLFGVPGVPLPDPMFRRSDAIYRALTGDYEFRGIFDPERVQLASATTGTLASLAVNAMNKVIINQFSNMGFWRWYERIVWVAPNDGSLHDMQWITFGGIGNLPTVTEGAAYTELSVDDVKEADAWVTKGGYVGITRKMMLNSDIQKIQAVPIALASACVRTRSAAVSDIFTQASGTGPTLDQDATALFHSNHGNVGSTAFSQSEWRVVRTAIFKHTDVNSAKRLGVFPKYALVPADLYDSALAVFGYGDGYPTSYTPETEDRGYGDPRPVPLVVPDWSDTNNWAAIVDPMVYPVIQMSYHQAPGGGQHPPCELFVAMDPNGGLLFSNDTLPIKVRDEFVVGVNGPRGVYKENVA